MRKKIFLLCLILALIAASGVLAFLIVRDKKDRPSGKEGNFLSFFFPEKVLFDDELPASEEGETLSETDLLGQDTEADSYVEANESLPDDLMPEEDNDGGMPDDTGSADETEGLLTEGMHHDDPEEIRTGEGSEIIRETETIDLEKVLELTIDPGFTFQEDAYVCALEIPVHVFYIDGTNETVKGLTDLLFTTTEETASKTRKLEKDKTEVTRSVEITESRWFHVEKEAKEARLSYGRYELTTMIKGADLTPPVITSVRLKNGDAWCTDEEILVETEETEGLEYCLVRFGDGEPEYGTKNTFTVNENGKYLVYVRDDSGNTATEEIEVNKIDYNAPVINDITVME